MIAAIPNLLSPKECRELVALLSLEAPEGEVSRNSSAATRVDRSLRRGRAAALKTDEHADVQDRVQRALLSINQRHFGFEIACVEPMQIARYSEGDEYGDHLDIGPGPAGLRKLSASVQLTHSDEYQGGNLVLWGTGSVDRSLGTMIVFPSYLVHRVEPVTGGVRHSLVAWACGLRAYR